MKALFDQIDTPGGHICACFLLIAIGAAFFKFGIPKAEDLIVGATGVMFGAMRGNGARQANPPKE